MSEKQEQMTQAADGDQNVDKIREILFGANMREYAQRFADLEKRLIAENEKLGQFLEKRLTGIATATQRELAGLAGRIDEQSQAISALGEDSRNELASVNHQVSERLSDLDDLLGKESQSLRNDMTGHFNELADQVKKTRDSLSAGINRESGRLESSKVGRQDLAVLLAELSDRLQKGDAQGGD